MVKKLEEREDEFYYEGARSIILDKECILEEIDNGALVGARFVECPVYKQADKIAFALAYEKKILGYFIIKPIDIAGFVGVQAYKGWICPELRGQGIYSRLRIHAQNGFPLISDPEGMTEKAFNSWIKEMKQDVYCFNRDSTNHQKIDEVQTDELFCNGELEYKWSLVLLPR